jgi:Cyclic nucleotide-binding domain
MRQRIESSITSISWIPSEAMQGLLGLPFEVGLARWDDPLPVRLDDIEQWQQQDRFRLANELRAWIEVEDGSILGCGYSGRGRVGRTRVRIGPASFSVPAVSMPLLQHEPSPGVGFVEFVQTAGGRTGVPAPRPVPRPPYVQMGFPVAWTTLALRIHADGRSEGELAGSSPFPRHWVYDSEGQLVAKSGLMELARWMNEAFGARTPWGGHDSPALVTAVETALERAISETVMRDGERPKMRVIESGDTLTEQGQVGDELYLLLDGVLRVEVSGRLLAEIGPGVIVGERALLEGGRRTATLRAVTRCRVAIAAADSVAHEQLATLAEGHRGEEGWTR